MDLPYTVIEVEQGTKEWIDLRLKYITASQISTLLNRNPYETIQELIDEKITGKTKEITADKQELFDKGHYVEEKARKALIGDGFNFKPRVILSKAVPELLASLDGMDEKYSTILEVKYVGAAKIKQLNTDKNLPINHYIQIQAQLLASGAKKCLYYASNDKEIFLKDIEPDLAFFETIKAAIQRFSVQLESIKRSRNDRGPARVSDPKLKKELPEVVNQVVPKELPMSKEVTIQSTNQDFTPNQIHLLKTQICPGASDDELSLFMAVANKAGLDPFSRQIFGIMRPQFLNGAWTKKLSIQTSIDGFRVIAARTGEYEGQVGPFWCGADGVWKDIWLSNMAPSAAKVGVWRKGFKEPIYASARFESYVQKTKDGKITNMWQKFSDLMIAKCAESLALRRAFPNELSGLYTSDEMSQAQALDRKTVIINKQELFDRAINLISNQVTHQAVEAVKIPQPLPKAVPEDDFDKFIAEAEELEKSK